MSNAWGFSWDYAWGVSWGAVTPPSHSDELCFELREDGGFELRQDYGYEAIEVCEEVGGGETPDGGIGLRTPKRHWRDPNSQWAKGMQQWIIHEAAVRLGTKGGIASGKSRRW